MPNDDDIEQGNPPVTPPEDDIEEQEMLEPVPEPVSAPELEINPVPTSKWDWIGSPSRPEAQKSSDGISDLFEVDNEDDTEDLISVDIEKDIIDGDLDDLTEVSEEDILGDEETGQVPLDYKPDIPSYRVSAPRVRRALPRYIPPTSIRRTG